MAIESMLELRPSCEHCGTGLPNGAPEAMICTFECTFCAPCVEGVLHNVCPNCGGGFERRPTRPKAWLAKHPASVTEVRSPVEENSFLEANRNVDPHQR